jgi:hypothetical protein
MKTAVFVAELLAVLSLCQFTAAKNKPDTSLTIVPGPMEMSAEEKAIVPDPAEGTEHALILLEETELNENLGAGFQLAYHLRAKILSSEGRDLANIEIPTVKHESKLKRWWGRAMASDGRVFELRESELQDQSVVKAGAIEYRALKGVIPGVEPGTVIDYGYVLSGAGFYHDTVLELQRRFAIKRLRYRWIPFSEWQGEYVLHGSESRNVSTRVDGRALLIDAHDMRPVSEEPYMPPQSEVQTTVTFFYSSGGSPELYWIRAGGAIDAIVAGYGPKDKSVQLVLAQMPWPAGADLRAKVRFVYDWVGKNIRSTGAMSAEEFEMIGSIKTVRKAVTARTVLSERYGTPVEMSLLFASLARALGADARFVLAVDRRLRYWDPEIKSIDQFSYFFVAVRMPGESDEQAVVVDPSSGLPYGELPWQATGTHAVVAVAGGFRTVGLLPTMADRNVGETEVALTFEPDGEALVAHWSFVGQGQQGRDSRATLRAASVEERVKRLDSLCASGSWEARQSAAPDVQERTAPFRLTCDIETEATNFDASLDRYLIPLPGPWWPEVPSFPESSRRQPVIFPFPRTDHVRADVTAPPGFAPVDPPSPVTMESSIGSYAMEVTSGERGFHVERKLVIKPLKVLPEGYEMVRKFFADVARADRTPLTFRRASPAP